MVTPGDILQIQKDRAGKPLPNGKWLLHGRELTQGEKDNLKAEAELIAKTALWKILISEGKYHAQKYAIIDTDSSNDKKDLSMLRKAQAYHNVVVLFENFVKTIAH